MTFDVLSIPGDLIFTLITIAGLFGRSTPQGHDEAAAKIVLNKQAVVDALEGGLSSLSDASHRNDPDAPVSGKMLPETAQAARDILDRLNPPEPPQQREGGWFW